MAFPVHHKDNDLRIWTFTDDKFECGIAENTFLSCEFQLVLVIGSCSFISNRYVYVDKKNILFLSKS